MVFSCFAVYVLANNIRVVPYLLSSCMAAHSFLYTAYKFGVLDDSCIIKINHTRSFDPFPNHQPFPIIGQSSNKLFMHVCPIPMCAFCAVARIA